MTTTTIADDATSTAPGKGKVGGVVDQLLADAPRVVEEIELDVLVPHPDNPRESLGDLGDLARSIEAAGVLEPLIVVTGEAFNAAQPAEGPFAPDDLFVIVAGHRRHAAAQLAAIPTVPCIIRNDLAGAEGRAMMLIENMFRAPLTALEEAEGFGLLKATFKWTQTEIGERVGCEQSHVSKRLQLLKLPHAIKTRIDMPATQGGVQIELALTISRQPKELQEQIAERLTEQRSYGSNTVAVIVDDMTRAYERDKERTAALTAIRDLSIPVLNADGDTISVDYVNYSRENGPVPLNWIYGQVEDLWLGHATEPCHAAIIASHQVKYGDDVPPADRWVSYVCTDPAAHKTSSETPADVELTDEQKAQQTEIEAQRVERERKQVEIGEANTARWDFIQTLISQKPAKNFQTHIAAGAALDSILASDLYDRAQHTFDAMEVAGRTCSPSLAAIEALETGDTSSTLLQQWALTARLVEDDRDTRGCLGFDPDALSDYRVSAAVARFHLRFLVSCGYEPRPVERTLLDDTTCTVLAAAAELEVPGLSTEPDTSEGNDTDA